MSDVRRLAAGVIATGFDGLELTPEIALAIHELGVAGWILFARNVANVEQTRVLTDAIRAGYPVDVPPILAIDQEGGPVARLRAGVELLPAMMAVCAADDAALAHSAGEQLAFDLRRAGLNLDFAPVIDLAVDPQNTVIGSRSFGSDPARVVRFAGNFAAGLEAGGIAATFKHYPGHGSTAIDSHLDLPVIEIDAATLRGRDLVPFSQLLPAARAVMTAHVVAPAFDAAVATLSHRFLTEILRDEIGFAGVTFTDCMQMDAIARRVGSASGAVLALIAGADCILISHSLGVVREAIAAIEAAVAAGTLPLERLREANGRVEALRRCLTLPLPIDAVPPHPGIGAEIGLRAVTRVRGDATLKADDTVVVSFYGATSDGVRGVQNTHASLSVVGLIELRAPLDPDADAIEELVRDVRATSRRPVIILRRAHIYGGQRVAAERLLDARPDAVVVSAREPFDTVLVPQARDLLCIYGDDPPSIGGLCEVLFAGAAARGTLPVELVLS